jgi:branched-chain amino acid transport system permease protein
MATARLVRAGVSASAESAAIVVFARRHHLRLPEAIPWVAALAAGALFPSYLPLGAQILAMILFALSADLVLGYAGIVTLGHAAFFGTGAYTAGILAAHGWGEPITGLLAGSAAAALVGVASGFVVLRTTGLTLLMQTLVVATLLYEAANKASWLTHGDDGLPFEAWSIFGEFRFDMFGRTAFVYCLVVLFLCWLLARQIVHSPFGRSLTGIRENVRRMHAIGAPVVRRRLIIYTVSAALAGTAGALIAQTTQFVGLTFLNLERSGTVLIMLIIGGVGRLYGAFIGVPLYMIAQNQLSESQPVYWYFWLGLMMVLIVVFARGGIFGLFEAIVAPAGPTLKRYPYFVRLLRLVAGAGAYIMIIILSHYEILPPFVSALADSPQCHAMLSVIIGVAILVISSHRLRDMGRSGWFSFLLLVPLINVVMLLVLLFAPSRSRPAPTSSAASDDPVPQPLWQAGSKRPG